MQAQSPSRLRALAALVAALVLATATRCASSQLPASPPCIDMSDLTVPPDQETVNSLLNGSATFCVPSTGRLVSADPCDYIDASVVIVHELASISIGGDEATYNVYYRSKTVRVQALQFNVEGSAGIFAAMGGALEQSGLRVLFLTGGAVLIAYDPSPPFSSFLPATGDDFVLMTQLTVALLPGSGPEDVSLGDFVACAFDENSFCPGIEDTVALPGGRGVFEGCGGVRSDPHFTGLDGRRYDVTGHPGTVYSLVSDDGLAVNALFGTAYTTGLDAATGLPYRARGTWVTAVGVVTPAGSLAVYANGTVDPGPGLAVAVDWPRVYISTESMDLAIAAVPPPAEWGVPAPQAADLAHINLSFERLVTGPRVHGLLGATAYPDAKLRAAAAAAAATREAGRNLDGEGVVEGSVAEYAMEGLLATGFAHSAYGSY